MSTELDSAQILPLIYDAGANAIQVELVGGGSGSTNVAVVAGGNVVTKPYDYLAIAYVPSGNGVGQIQTVRYYLGGSGGTLQNTVTLAYDSSNNVISLTKT